DDGLETLYAHLSRIDAQLGQQVTIDTRLGEAGATGWATGAHLHFEVRRDGKAFDPLPLMTAPPPVVTPPAIPEPPPDDEDTRPLPPEPALHGVISADEARQLAVLFSQASNIFANIAQRMAGG